MVLVAKLKKYIIKSFLFVLITIFVFDISGTIQNYNATNMTYSVFPNENGGFYMLSSGPEDFFLYRINTSGVSEQAMHENIKSVKGFYGYNKFYIYANYNGYVPIMKLNNGKVETIILENINIKDKCVTADKNERIYAVDTGKPNEVVTFKYDGVILSRLDTGATVSTLFTDEISGKSFAVNRIGVCDIESGNVIVCDIPSGYLKINGKYCTDNNGNVYTFNQGQGFVRIMSVGYSCAVVSGDSVFVKDGRDVLMLDGNGMAVAKYSCGGEINDIYSVNSNIGVLCGSGLIVINNKMFERLKQPEQSTQSSEPKSSIADNKTDASIPSGNRPANNQSVQPQNSPEPVEKQKNYVVSSVSYKIQNGIICDVPQGTTIAQLKKNITYGDNTVTFINHNGKNIKSGKVGTGWTVIFEGEKTQSYLIAVYGDLTGEGNINSRDVGVISDYIVDSAQLNEIQLVAADMNFDGKINSTDLYIILRKYFQG